VKTVPAYQTTGFMDILKKKNSCEYFQNTSVDPCTIE